SLTGQTGTGGAVDVTVRPGETWTCTFSNTTNTATVKVIKIGKATWRESGKVNGTGPNGTKEDEPTSVVTSAAATAGIGVSLVAVGGSSVHLAEVQQTGCPAGAVSCTAPSLTGQTGTGGAVDVTVRPGETWTCTFSNTTNTATVKVI